MTSYFPVNLFLRNRFVSNLPSPRDSGRLSGASSPMPSGRRGSRVVALEAELKDSRRISASGCSNNNGSSNSNINGSNNKSRQNSLLSAQQQRSLVDEEPQSGGRSGGGCGGGGGVGSKSGKPGVSLNREKMSIADLEKRLAGDWTTTRQNNRRASLAQSLGQKEDQPSSQQHQQQQQQQQQQQKQKRSKSKGRDSFMAGQSASCFDRRF